MRILSSVNGEELESAVLSSDGRFVAAAVVPTLHLKKEKRPVYVWDLRDAPETPPAELPAAKPIRLRLGPASRHLAWYDCGHAKIRIVPFDGRKRKRGVWLPASFLVMRYDFNHDGSQLVGAGVKLQRWNTATGRAMAAKAERWPGTAICSAGPAVSPGGDQVAVAFARSALGGSAKGLVHVWELPGGAAVKTLRLDEWVYGLNHSPCGTWMALRLGRHLLVCDALTLKEVARLRPKGLKPPKGPRRDIFGRQPATLHSALFPSPSRLAVGCCDGTVRFWDTRTWKEQASLYPAIGPICDLGFSPAANVAVAMAGVKVAVWEKGEWGG